MCPVVTATGKTVCLNPTLSMSLCIRKISMSAFSVVPKKSFNPCPYLPSSFPSYNVPSPYNPSPISKPNNTNIGQDQSRKSHTRGG